jgi:hypothetical protein
MKRVVKYKQRPVEVVVCDNCGKDLGSHAYNAYAEVQWSQSCPVDECYYDAGSMAFCSHDCFNAGIHKLLDNVPADEEFYRQNVTLTVYSKGQGDNLHGFLTGLTRPPES